MMNTPQATNKPAAMEPNAKLYAKIGETWNKLNEEDIKLYTGNRGQFFTRLQEKQHVSKEEAEKRLQEIEKSVAAPSGSNKTDTVKAA